MRSKTPRERPNRANALRILRPPTTLSAQGAFLSGPMRKAGWAIGLDHSVPGRRKAGLIHANRSSSTPGTASANPFSRQNFPLWRCVRDVKNIVISAISCPGRRQYHVAIVPSPDIPPFEAPRHDRVRPTATPSRFEHVPVAVYASSVEGSRAVARDIAALIQGRRPGERPVVLGLATGSTPLSLYAELVRMHREEGLSFAECRHLQPGRVLPDAAVGSPKLPAFHAGAPFRPHRHQAGRTPTFPDGTAPASRRRRLLPRPTRSGSPPPAESTSRSSGSAAPATSGSTSPERPAVADPPGHPGPPDPPRRRRGFRRRGEHAEARHHDGREDDSRGPAGCPHGLGRAQGGDRARGVRGPGHRLRSPPRSSRSMTSPFCGRRGRGRGAGPQPHALAARGPGRPGPGMGSGMVRRAIIWLSRIRKKAVLKLTDDDYNEAGLQDLLRTQGSAYDVNLAGFYQLQHTITGWPGGRDPKRTRPGTLRPVRCGRPRPRFSRSASSSSRLTRTTTSSEWAAPSAASSSTAMRSTSPTRSRAPTPFPTRRWRAPCGLPTTPA